MGKKLTHNGSRGQQSMDSIIDVGLDVGYGHTKAVTVDQVVMFPSVVAHNRELKYMADESARKHPGDQLMDEGAWFVGELAQVQASPAEQIRLRGRTADENALGNVIRARLAKAALGKLFPGRHNGDVVHIRLATGLPVDHMGDAGSLKQALIGQHLIQTDQTNFVANIVDCMVMPQPYGSIYSKLLTSAGEIDPCHTANVTGVVDVGTFTVDVTLDDNGEYIDNRSGSVEGGVHLTLERIKSAVNRDFRQMPDDRMAESILRTGCIRVRGETVPYQDVVNESLEPLRSATLTLMNAKWGPGAFIDVIYLSGGGALLVVRQVKAAYGQAVVLDQAQLANARGYLQYALFKQTA